MNGAQMEGGENMTDSGFGSRCELMLDVTFQTLRSDPELKLCEGLRLIDATRTAISRIAPASLNHFDREVLPRMRTALMERFGLSELPGGPVN